MSSATLVKGTAVIPIARRDQPQTFGSGPQEVTSALSGPVFAESSELTLFSVFHEDYYLSMPIKVSLRVANRNAVVAWKEAGIIAEAFNLGEALTRFRSIVLDSVDEGENMTVLTHVERRVNDSDLANAMRDVSMRAFQLHQDT
jgi:hypothetical protein